MSTPNIKKQFLRYFLFILEIFHFNWGTCWNVRHIEFLAWFLLVVADTCIVCDFYPLRRFQLFLKKQFVSFFNAHWTWRNYQYYCLPVFSLPLLLSSPSIKQKLYFQLFSLSETCDGLIDGLGVWLPLGILWSANNS